jgi:hypothetical protein
VRVGRPDQGPAPSYESPTRPAKTGATLCKRKAADTLSGAAFIAPGIRASKPDHRSDSAIMLQPFGVCQAGHQHWLSAQ